MPPSTKAILREALAMLALPTMLIALVCAAALAGEAPAGAYLADRFSQLYEGELRLDRAIAARASALGVTATAGAVAVEEEALALEIQSRVERPLASLEALLRDAGLPPQLVAEAIARRAWRRATAAAIIGAERRPTEAEVVRLFEREYGPGGVQRAYRHVLISTDPVSSPLYTAEDLARDQTAVRAEKCAAAERFAADLGSGRATFAALREYGGFDMGLQACAARIGAREIAAAPTKTAVVRTDADAAYVLFVERRYARAAIEAVKVVIRKLPGEEEAALLGRARAAAAELAGAADPQAYALAHSDDEEDRRTGGALRFGGAPRGRRDSGSPGMAEGGRPETDPGLIATLGAAFADLGVGMVIEPHRVHDGYVVARLVKKEAAPGPEIVEGRAARFPWDAAAVRLARFAPRADEIAARRMAEVAARAAAGEGLGQLAVEASHDLASAKSGGTVTTFAVASHGGAFVSAVEALPLGGPPEVIRSLRGYHLVRCEFERRTRLEDVRGKIGAELGKRRPGKPEIDRFLEDLAAASAK
jgi:hypothetical protein